MPAADLRSDETKYNDERVRKAIAAERAKMLAVLNQAFDITLDELMTGAPGLGDGIKLFVAQAVKRRLLAALKPL